MSFFTTPVGQYVVQVVVHSAILLVALEALMKLWRVNRPATRVQFRYLCLALPLLGWPLFQGLYPERGSALFRRATALIDTQLWLPIDLAGMPGWAWTVAVMGVGMALFTTRVLVPTARRHVFAWAPRKAPPVLRSDSRLENSLLGGGNLLGECARLVDEPWTAAQLTGVRCHRLVVSASLFKVLDSDELEAVLAHEEAHARRRDNRWGWCQFLLGLAMFYNPLSLIASQRISQEVELACDDEAVLRTGRPLALASALMKATRLSLEAAPRRRRFALLGWWSKLEDRILVELVTRRARRLADHEAAAEVPLKAFKLALTTLMSGALLFFVV